MGYLNKVIIGAGGAVTSVNTRIGAILLSQADVGLGNVQNTTDANKPISTATQTALDAKVDKTITVNGISLSANVVLGKSDVGLGLVDNTADLAKPISTAEQTALGLKVDKVVGYSLVADTTMPALSLPRWDDLSFELTQSRRGATLKPDYDFTNIGLLFPQNDVTEIAYLTFQIPHTWKQGSTIFPHVHVVQSANQQAVFSIDYKWYNLGDAVPASWTTYTFNQYAFAYTSGTVAQIIKKPVGISGVGKTISSILKIKLYRNDNVYVGDMLADHFDIHIEKDGFGSQSEFIKT